MKEEMKLHYEIAISELKKIYLELGQLKKKLAILKKYV